MTALSSKFALTFHRVTTENCHLYCMCDTTCIRDQYSVLYVYRNRSMKFMKLGEIGTTSFRNHFDYSNLMYMVVGCVAEVMSGGQSLETLMREKLFVPLGMLDTHIISELNDSDPRFAKMYLLDDETNSFQELDKYIVR